MKNWSPLICKNEKFKKLNGEVVFADYHSDRWGNPYLTVGGRVVTPFEFRLRYEPLTTFQILGFALKELYKDCHVETLLPKSNPLFNLIEDSSPWTGNRVSVPIFLSRI